MPTDPALVTGRLNLNDYVAARDSDIQKLEELISRSGVNAKKRAFQSLPRAERRRAASHDPKRVPRRKGLRKKAELENLRERAKKHKVSERPKKKIETSNSYIQDYTTVNTLSSASEFSSKTNLRYQNRQKDKLWLPTHIWHRKRASMELLAGIMVPRSATQKQYRKTFRLGTHLDETGAIAWDKSYVSTIIAHHPDLQSSLDQILPGSVTPIYHNGSKNWCGMLPGKGPVLLYWYSMSSVLFQCHPLLQQGLWDSLSSIEGIILEDCKFSIGSIDIAGPWALKVLDRVLSGCTFRSNEANNSWNQECLNRVTPSRCVYSMFVSDPRIRGHSGSRVNPNVESLGLLSQSTRQSSLAAQQPQKIIDKLLNSMEDSQREPIVPILIFGLDSGRFRVLMPRGWVLPFWLSIFKKGNVMLGGIEEHEHLALENGLLSFPRDFPETPAGWSLQLRIKEQKQIAFQKLPKSKRPNFKTEKGCPFMNADLTCLRTGTLVQYHHVKLTSLSRGVPREGARIYSNCTESHNEASEVEIKLIGFMTSGNFSLSTAKGTGIGIVTDISNLKHCQFRNVGDNVAHPAVLEQVTSIYI